MKKLFVALFAIASLLILAGCNKQVFDFNYKFAKVHVFSVSRCYEISSWRDYDDSDQIQVDIKGYGVVLFHSNQIALIETRCPFCGN